MTDRPKNNIDESTVAEWLRDLAPVEADPEFRERLASAFASGDIEDAAQPAGRAAPAPSPAPWWRWLVPVAVAAVAAFVIVVINRGPMLEFVEVTGAGTILVDGRPESAGTLRPGASITVPADMTVDLAAADIALWEVTAGTRMTVPRMPGRWFARTSVCSLFVGEMRLKTGGQFAGGTLLVYTPEGMVEVTGTLLSIQCDENGTCVCVLEGVANVGVNEEDLEPVEPGFRKIMLRDGTVDIIPVKAMHRDGVLDFDARMGSRLSE